jgi:glycosyltransferase involved in cell wall biosynthesis
MTPFTPLISVVMPVYNVEKFLNQAMESILRQTVADFELIVVDDLSTDQSPQILAEYKDPRIVLLPNRVNLGSTKSRNCALKIARGEYIALMDSDDVAMPNRLEVQVNALESSGAGMTHSNVEYIDASGQTTGQSARNFEPLNLTWKMLFDSYAFQPTFMWRRLLAERELGGYDESFPVAQDYDWAWRASRQIGIVGVQENLLQYRVHGSNVTASRRELQQELVGRASVAHLSQQFNLEPEEAKRLFQDVRELSIFRDPNEWTPQRIEEVLPRYIDLWKRFLAQNRVEAWSERPQALKDSLRVDLVNATGILIAARDIRRFSQSLISLRASQIMPPSVLLKDVVQHRWNERFLSKSKSSDHPTW